MKTMTVSSEERTLLDTLQTIRADGFSRYEDLPQNRRTALLDVLAAYIAGPFARRQNLSQLEAFGLTCKEMSENRSAQLAGELLIRLTNARRKGTHKGELVINEMLSCENPLAFLAVYTKNNVLLDGLRQRHEHVSLNTPIGDGEDSDEIGDLLPGSACVEAEVINAVQTPVIVSRIFDILGDRADLLLAGVGMLNDRLEAGFNAGRRPRRLIALIRKHGAAYALAAELSRFSSMTGAGLPALRFSRNDERLAALEAITDDTALSKKLSVLMIRTDALLRGDRELREAA